MQLDLEIKYPTEPIKCWNKAKELRDQYYRNAATARENGGILWSGGAHGLDPVPAGFGKKVYPLTGEPYGASVAFDKPFASKCHAAAEAAGYPRDLCAYMRNYLGSKLLNQYAFGGSFPEPDFYWQFHMCCSHGKWYQEVSRIEGKDKPVLVTDLSIGPCWKKNEETGHFYYDPPENGIRYIVDQIHEQIEKLEKILKRPFQDELLFEAAENYFDILTIWPEICILNQAIPAPLDAKSMFTLYSLSTLDKASRAHADFYRELRDEVQDRVDRGIGMLATERSRVMDDIQPPWGFLKIFRYLERYGCICIGSFYSMGLMFSWDIGEDGIMRKRQTPREMGIEIKDRDQCLEILVRYLMTQFWSQNMQDHRLKAYVMKQMYDQWHCDGVMIHYNRGCEGLSLNVAEHRLALVSQGVPVMTYEGNMGDEREFDETETMKRIDTFMETLGLK
ncbi:MAG: benzoyl-CoA reductase, bzd-type, subunit O [Desulfobacterales bacterium]|nr:benzoyl-CoA reductase, bzd-type, subunit O [Desulfobacterales bacterium]